TGRYREAIGEAQRAFARYAQAGPTHRVNANQTKHMLINLYELVGDYASAQPLWEEWLGDPFGSQADGTLSENRAHAQAILLNGLAENLARQGKLAEAEATYRRTLPLAAANEIIRRNTERGLAELLLARGDAAGAESLLRAQFDFWMRMIGTDSWMGPNNLCCATATARAAKVLADALSRQDKMDEARQLYGLAARTELRFDGPRHPTTSLYHYLHARSLLATAPSTALAEARVAMEGARFRRLRASQQASAAELDATYRGTSGYFSLMLDALFRPEGSGDAPMREALGIVQEAMVSSTDGAIALMAAQRLRKRLAPALAAALDGRAALTKEAVEIDRRLTADLLTGGSGPERQQLVTRLDAIARQLEAIDATIRQGFPEYFDLLRPGPVTLAEAQAVLKPDEAVLLFVPGQTGVHALAVTREGLRWQRSALSVREIEDMARQLLYAAGADVEYTAAEKLLWDAQTGGGADGYPRKTAFALYRQLVDPLLPALAGKRQVFVAAAGRLGAMPFTLLVSGEPQGADNDPAALRATRWLVDDFALAQLPSLQSLVTLRRLGTKPRGGGAGSFAGFGDPLVYGEPSDGEPVAGGAPDNRGARRGTGWRRVTALRGDWFTPETALADPAELRKLDRLKGTAAELRDMADMLGAKRDALHLDMADTETAVRTTDLSKVRILAFATHGLTASQGVVGEPG
ncbi:MAG: CHAT domain-containing protein, partial [Sphingomonadaceae bacterium]